MITQPYVDPLFPAQDDDEQQSPWAKVVSPTPADQLVPQAAAVQPVATTSGAQPVVRQGLAGRMQQMLASYNNSAAPAQYAASQAASATDPANPDPNASLRPGGTAVSLAGAQPVQPTGAMQVNGPSQLDRDTSQLNRLKNTGSGIDQIKNPIGRGFARAGNIALGLLAPGVAPFVPGTQEHHQQLLGRQQGLVDADQDVAKTEASIADTQQQGLERKALADKATALAGADQAINLSPEQAAGIDHPELAGIPVGQRAYATMVTAKQRKDSAAGHDQAGITKTGMNNDTSKANTDARTTSSETIAQARNKTQQLMAQLRASVSSANNQRTNAAHLTTAGMRAAGSATGQPGSFKVPADVTKRAALASNVQENAGEVSKLIDANPKIIGAVQGRFTNAEQMIGNDNPAISALGTRIHNIALAANGAHGVRSQEAVHATEKEILNNFRNGPHAIKGALNATTTSVQTFLDDERNFRQTGGRVVPTAPTSGPAPSGKAVSLNAARALPQNKGKSDAEITKDIESHGHKVAP